MQTRPSDLYCVGSYKGDPVSFWFDRAVINFGHMVQQDLERASEGAKDRKTAESVAKQRLMKWLDYDGKMTNQRFATPPITKTR